jgi:hypothetical protein
VREADSCRGRDESCCHAGENINDRQQTQSFLSKTQRLVVLLVGSCGHGGLAEALLVSVSQHCAHHAQCRSS